MTVPGTIARSQNTEPRRESEDASAKIARGPDPSPARQSATPQELLAPPGALTSAEPWFAHEPQSRREYFRSLIPGLGALLVRGLRGAEEFQRQLAGSAKEK